MPQHTHAIPLSTFGPLRDGQTSIGHQMVWRQGVGGAARLPVEEMSAGDTLTITVPVPPGVSTVGWYAEANNYVMTFSANGGPELGYPQTLHTETARQLETVTGTIKALQPLLLMSLAITWTVADPARYEAWRTNGAVPQPDPNPMEQMLSLAAQSGVITALQRLTGIDDTGKLGDAAVRTGLAHAMLNFMHLAQRAKN